MRSLSVGARGGMRNWSLPAKETVYRSLDVAPQKSLALPHARAAPKATPAVSLLAAATTLALAPLLPPAPFTLEKFTHFEVTQPSTAEQVVQQLRAAIESAGASAEFNPAKHKFKGMAYDENNFHAVRFTARVYRTGSDGTQRHVVEFQRRHGCCMAWLGFYDDVLSRCDALNEAAAATARSRAEKRGARTAAFSPSPPPCATSEGLEVIADMAACDFEESRLEACRSLALLTTSGPTARAVARHERCLEATLGLLRSSDGDVKRCAVAAVANVVEGITQEHEPNEQDRAAFAQLRLDIIQPMVAVTAVSTPRGGGHLAETRRHAVRALAALARESPEAASGIAAVVALTPDALGAMRLMAASSRGPTGDSSDSTLLVPKVKDCWRLRHERSASDAAFVLQHCGM